MTETWRTTALGVPSWNQWFGVDFYDTGMLVVDQEILIELQDIAAVAREAAAHSCDCSDNSGCGIANIRQAIQRFLDVRERVMRERAEHEVWMQCVECHRDVSCIRSVPKNSVYCATCRPPSVIRKRQAWGSGGPNDREGTPYIEPDLYGAVKNLASKYGVDKVRATVQEHTYDLLDTPETS